jgi:NAD(P)H dehydrogenase (quinone)
LSSIPDRYGNTAKMAQEITKGTKEVAGPDITLRRIADDVSMQVIEKNPFWVNAHQDLEKRYPPSSNETLVVELANYDAIIFGSPTRFGNMAG